MRLPTSDTGPASINEVEPIRMIRYAIDHGVNYLDSGCHHSMSQPEVLNCISRALQEGYRQKIKIAATLPSFFISSPRDFDRYLDTQLRCLQTERIDFYLLGGLNRETWPALQGLDVLCRAEAALAGGRIHKLGFSFHDDFPVLRGILDGYDSWAFCQFQYSYMDVDHHPGVVGLKYAAERGLAVVISEPLRGGRLAREPAEPVARVWAGALKTHTLSGWGLRWIWDHPEVSTVVSDMSTMEQVMENVSLADSAEPDSLSIPEQVLVSRVREAYRRLRPVPCSSCRACMPCPQGIDVPRVFELYNDAIMYGDVETARSFYNTEQHRIDICTECGKCVNACGKKIAILDWLEAAHKLLGKR